MTQPAYNPEFQEPQWDDCKSASAVTGSVPIPAARKRVSNLQKAVAFWDSFRIKNPAPAARRQAPTTVAAEVEELRRRNAALEAQLREMRWVDVERLELHAENARLKRCIIERSKVTLMVLKKRK